MNYDYSDASDTQDGPQDFEAQFSIVDLDQGIVAQATRGNNLVLSPPGDRGQTDSYGELVSDPSKVGGVQHSAHLLADQFMGSGYREALNLVLTSGVYNTQTMGGAERAIRAVIEGYLAQYPQDLITFDLQVNVEWQDMHDGEIVRALDAIIQGKQQSANLSSPEDLEKLKETTLKTLQGRQDPRMVKGVKYRGFVYRNGEVIMLLQEDIGEDIHFQATLT